MKGMNEIRNLGKSIFILRELDLELNRNAFKIDRDSVDTINQENLLNALSHPICRCRFCIKLPKVEQKKFLEETEYIGENLRKEDSVLRQEFLNSGIKPSEQSDYVFLLKFLSTVKSARIPLPDVFLYSGRRAYAFLSSN